MKKLLLALALIFTSPAYAQFSGCGNGLCYSSIPLNAITLPITANLSRFYSIVKLSTWGGNCLRVRRSSDNTEQDIGFVRNIVDWAAADTFAAGSNLFVTKIYDQTGSGDDLVQATQANQPAFTALNNWVNGMRPVTFDGLQSSTSKFMTAAPVIDRTNHTIYQIVSPRGDFGVTSYYDLTDAGFTTSYASMSNSAQNLSAIYNGQFVITPTPMLGGPGVASFTSASNNTQILRTNGIETARSRTVAAQAIGLLNVGRLVSGTGNNAINDLFAFVVYAASHTSPQMQSIEAALTAAFQPQTYWSKQLIYGGTSLFLGQGATLNQQPAWQMGFGRGPMGDVWDYKTYVMSVGGQTLATEFANSTNTASANYTGLIDLTKSKNVCVIGDITNDLLAPTYGSQSQAETAADTFYSTITIPFFQTLKNAGCSVVIPTMIARGPYTTANFKEYARLRYNVDVLAGIATYGYVVSDRGGNVNFNSPAATANATYYQADATHLTNVGYGIVAGIDKAAILSY